MGGQILTWKVCVGVVKYSPGRCVWGWSNTHLEGGEVEDSPGRWRVRGLTWKVARPKTHLEGGEAEDSPRNLLDLVKTKDSLEGSETEDSSGRWRDRGLTWKVARSRTHMKGREVEDSPGRWQRRGGTRR